MVEIGSVIRGKVNRVEPYGVWLEYGREPVLVLAPEVSWTEPRPLREVFRTDDECDVVVLRYNDRDRVIVGSIRRLHPEQNPYRQLASLQPGTILGGRVRLLAGDQVTIELPNRAWGHVPRHTLPDGVQTGDGVDVEIVAIEVDEGRLLLAPVVADAHAANGCAPVPAKPPQP